MNIIRFCSSLLSAAAPLSLHSFECMQYHHRLQQESAAHPTCCPVLFTCCNAQFRQRLAPPLFHSLYSGILLDHYWQPEQCDAHSPDHCPSLPALTALPARAGPLVAGPQPPPFSQVNLSEAALSPGSAACGAWCAALPPLAQAGTCGTWGRTEQDSHACRCLIRIPTLDHSKSRCNAGAMQGAALAPLPGAHTALRLRPLLKLLSTNLPWGAAVITDSQYQPSAS